MGWWSDFFSLFSGPLEFIEWLTEQIIGKFIDKIKEALHVLWDIISSPFHAIYNTLLHFMTNIYYAAEDIAGPFAPILFISVAGIMVMGVLWVLKRLYELL